MSFTHIIKHESARKVLVRLPISIREKFARPRVPHAVHDFYGNEELRILSRAIIEIAYKEVNGVDGNWTEFISWTGLTEEDMEIIKQEMLVLGWTTDVECFNY